MTYYVQPHKSQYASGASAITRSSGCTWTSTANGIMAASGGKTDVTPDQVHAKVARTEETTPATPGWSLQDVKLACDRLKVGFSIKSGTGWASLVAYSEAGYYVVLQGDSDQFSDATCSGAFNGDHAIGAHPERHSDGRWLINDPICKSDRWETEAVLRKYAEKLWPSVRFGIFTTKVPMTEATMPTLYFKPDAPSRHGTAAMDGPGHSLILFDGRKTRARADGETYTVYASGVLNDINGIPTDIDGNQPPKGNREKVYQVYREPWGNAAYVLQADVKFTEDVAAEVVPPSEVACKPYVDAAVAADRAKAKVGVTYE